MNESRTVVVDPAVRYSPSDIEIMAGETYRFEASGKWRDASIVCGPEGWNRLLVAWGLPFNRVRFRNYFALCGNLGQSEGTNFYIGKSSNWTAPSGAIQPGKTASLFLFANDLWSFYGNNSSVPENAGGPLVVRITRTG